MAIYDYISARTRTPSISVWLNGKRWRGIISASASQEYGQGIASGQLVGRDPPVTPTAGMAIRWTWGYSGVEVPGFTGYIVVPERQSYPNRWSLQCTDALWPAQRESQPIAVDPLNNVTAQAAINYILETYGGNPRKSIPDIKRPSDSGTSWTLGQLTPVSWTGNTTALAACQEIAQTAGYWLFADAGGTVRALQIERRPSDSPFRILRKGDAAGATLLVSGAPTRRQDANQVRNRITVRGANTGVEGAQLFDTFQATHALLPGVTNTLEYQTFLIEYEDDITAVAERIVGVWNRVPNTIEARIKADPRLAVGATVGIVDENIGYSSTQNFFVYRLSTSFDVVSGKFDQQITLDGGVGDAGFSTIPNPIAAISVLSIETETLDGTPVAVVRVDGSGSYSLSGGEIVAYQWDTSSTYGGTPDTATTVQASFLFAMADSPVTISLMVTDTSSKTDSTSIDVDLTAADGITPIATEGLQIAFNAAWLTTIDGGATWNTLASNTYRVPPIGASVWDSAPVGDVGTYGYISTFSDTLRISADVALTNITSIGVFDDVTALSVNARNASRVWIATGSQVWRSIDGGNTFESWGTPSGSTVTDIIEDPALNNSVFCLAGADMYQSIGSTPDWGVFYAGPVGATARWMQRSESGVITWICYTGTFTGSPLQRVEGPVSVTFPVVSPTVDEIRAIALLDNVNPVSPQLIAIDQESRIWMVDGLTGSVSASAVTYPTGSTVQHAVPSRDLPLVYIADYDSVVSGQGAVRKYFTEMDSLFLFKAGGSDGYQARMVGLITGTQSVNTFILRLPTGATGDADSLHIYQNTAWTFKALPESGRTDWQRVVANPFDYRKLLLFRWATGNHNALWYSDNFGDTWTNIFTDITFTDDQAVPPVDWSPTSATEWMTTNHQGGSLQQLIRGTLTSYSVVWTQTGGGLHDRLLPNYGVGGEIVWIDSSGNVGWFDSATNTPTVGTSGLVAYGYADTVRLTRQWIVPQGASSDAKILTNYLSGTVATLTGAQGANVALLSDGTAFLGGRANGIQQVLDPFGSPSISVITETGNEVKFIRSDRQTQNLVACVIPVTSDFLITAVRDASGVWGRITAPPVATALTNWVEVIGVVT